MRGGGQRNNSNKEGVSKALDCTLQLSETQFEEKEEEHQWECVDDSGSLLEIDVPYEIDYKDPRAGLIESGVTTLHVDDAVILDNNKAIFKSEPKLAQTPKEHRRRLKTTGNRSVLVVRVEAKDFSTSASEEELARKVFGIGDSTGVTDSWNLSSGFDQCSYGQLKFEPAQYDAVKDGVYTVSIDQNVKGARHVDVRTAALNSLRSDFGTSDLKALYDHVMLCIPPGTVTKQGEFANHCVVIVAEIYSDSISISTTTLSTSNQDILVGQVME